MITHTVTRTRPGMRRAAHRGAAGTLATARTTLVALVALFVVAHGCGPAAPVDELSVAGAPGVSDAASALGASGAATGATARPTTVVVVRHAERAPGDDDPHLSDEGAARAQTLSWMFQDAGVSTIYSTPYHRTRETVGPLAERLGLEVRLENVGGAREDGDAPYRAFAQRILERHPGEVVLVAGHSNTVPGIVTAFGAGEVGPLTTEEYDHLFVLSLPATGPPTLLRLHFGEASPPLAR
jgi:phosphohistidine phosphatase SixA